jgi:crossover junction endodeoxyribonuclease RusA
MTPFTLPYPPSANRIWRNTPQGTKKSAAYRSWLAEAVGMMRLQRPAKVLGKYVLSIVVTRPDKRQRDLDNLAKPISDALKLGGIIEDDHLCDTLILAWADEAPVKGGAVSVHVRSHQRWEP